MLSSRIILTSGAFDSLHSGHVRYFRVARALGQRDFLYVAIAPDSYIRSAKHREPYWSQADRAETIEALKGVDAVILQETDSVADVIRHWLPRLFVKGADWRDKLPEDVLAACQAAGTEIRFVSTPGRHVSEALR